MEFELGRTYTGYKFLDVVRRSRSVVQYRVQNTIAQRLENLQTLPGAATDDQDASERFLREVRIRAHITHPHVVSFFTALPLEGRMVMTTELYEGLPLAERLQLGPLPWRMALDITRQILDVLACLHQQSFVHCDITPENIQVGPEGFCKLSSFALARPLGVAHAPESGAVVGDPKYISPEQVKGGPELDQRSDLYSLGVVLYEMLCGRPPFESRSQFELMLAHVNQAPVPPSEVNRGVPQSLDGLVLKALAKDPADRYPTAQDWSTALNDAEASGKPGAVVEVAAVPEAEVAIAFEVAEPVVEAAEVAEAEVATVAEVAEPVVEAAAVPEAEVATVAEVAEPVFEAVAVPEVKVAIVFEVAEPVIEAVAVPEAEVATVAEVAEPVVEAVAVPEVEVAIVPGVAELVVEAVAVPEVEVATVAEVAEPVVEAVAAQEAEVAIVAEVAETVVEAVAAPEVEIAIAAEVAETVVEAVAAQEAEVAIVAEAPEPVVEAVAAPEVKVAIAAPEPELTIVAAVVAPVVEAVAAPETPVSVVAVVAPSSVPDAAPFAVTAPPVPQAPPKAAAATAAGGGPLQSTLWAAASMVAISASTSSIAAFLPPSESTLQLVKPTVALPAPAAIAPASIAPASIAPASIAPGSIAPPPAFAPNPTPYSVPGLIAGLRQAPDTMAWFVFGGTAAFLGVIWAAIWFAAGK